MDGDNRVRWYSAVTSVKLVPNKAGASTQLNLKNGLFLGNRYESTAAESDASSPPPPVGEKYEYQAEVIYAWNLGLIHFIFRGTKVLTCYFLLSLIFFHELHFLFFYE